MRSSLRVALVLPVLVAVPLLAGGVAVGRGAPTLTTGAVVGVTGTEASGTFQVAERTIRQVRYDDGGTLAYTFEVTNPGRLPVTLTGLADEQPPSRLFGYADLTAADGDGDRVSIAGGSSEPVTLHLSMGGCESLSSRAGAFVTEVVVRTEQAGVFGDDVRLRLPEELHTGSPREAFCPESTATSRPPG